MISFSLISINHPQITQNRNMTCPLSTLAIIASMAATDESEECTSTTKRPAAADTELGINSPGDDTIIADTTNENTKGDYTETMPSDETFEINIGQPSFPVILMGIMCASLNQEYATFLDEQNFVILDSEGFEKKVLSVYYADNATTPTFSQFLNLLSTW